MDADVDTMIRRLARRFARHAPRWLIDEEDLYQEGWIAYLESPVKIHVSRRMIDHLRYMAGSLRPGRAKSRAAVIAFIEADDSLPALQTPSYLEAHTDMEQFISSLPRKRQAVLRDALHGYDTKEIAIRQEIAPKSVSVHLFHAKQQWRKYD